MITDKKTRDESHDLATTLVRAMRQHLERRAALNDPHGDIEVLLLATEMVAAMWRVHAKDCGMPENVVKLLCAQAERCGVGLAAATDASPVTPPEPGGIDALFSVDSLEGMKFARVPVGPDGEVTAKDIAAAVAEAIGEPVDAGSPEARLLADIFGTPKKKPMGDA